MKMEERVIVFPYDIQFSPVVRHKSILKNYEVVGLVSPSGWGFCNKDASIVDGGTEINLQVDENFDYLLENCDTVIFSDSHLPLDFEKIIYPNLVKAANKKKNIVYLRDTRGDEKNKIDDICKKNEVYFKHFCNEYKDMPTVNEKLIKICTPIIFVLGVGERNQKFEIQLTLRERLQEIGYKVSQIGSRHYCELLGFHSFPGFMFNSISETQKIVLFNYYVKEIEMKEEPDLIIIGIPGGTMKINDVFTSNFGIFAYEVSQFIMPDAVIMSTFYDDFKLEYFERLSSSAIYKLGYAIDCFNLANIQLDWLKVQDYNDALYLTLGSSFIDIKKDSYVDLQIPVFNIFNQEDAKKMVYFLIDKLGKYAEYEVI